jgi:hypothetical protein
LGYQPVARFRWLLQRIRKADGDAQAAATSGKPFGGLQRIGALPASATQW